jgi:predicted transcriptional regulator
LSIKPQYAAAIFAGDKKYEFRRVIFSRRVDIVVIYATAPVRQVVGEFAVLAVISESPRSLWERTKEYAGVDKDAFFRYFRGRQMGYAIQIGEVRQYAEPFCPITRLGLRPPQSFVYLKTAEEAI